MIEQATETALKTAITAGLTADGITASIRAFFIDDEASDHREDLIYPMVGIVASPATPQPADSYQSTFMDVPCTVVCATHAEDDPKRTNLWSLYASVRKALDRTALVISGANFSGTIITGGNTGMDGNEQTVEINVTVRTCGYAYS